MRRPPQKLTLDELRDEISDLVADLWHTDYSRRFGTVAEDGERLASLLAELEMRGAEWPSHC